VGDFLNQLQTTRVVSCTEAAWRFLGLSLAGWNVLISLALADLALVTAIGNGFSFGRKDAANAKPYGSSSLSQ
jgi:disulfide bond formation protein DsbB